MSKKKIKTFEQVAIEYADINVFNHDTRETVIRIGELFDRRARCTLKSLSLKSITVFKTETLKLAKPITYNGYLRYLRLLGDYACESGYIKENLFRKVKTAPVGVKAKKFVSDNDLYILLNHLAEEGHRYEPVWFWEAVIKTLYFTGIRRRQLVSLLHQDLLFDKGEESIFLRYEGSKTHREWFIPMHQEVVTALKVVIAHNRSVLERDPMPEEPVFNLCWYVAKQQENPNKPGFMKAEAITDFFRRSNKRTGLRISPHKFRHSVATRLCNPIIGDPDIFGTQRLLGHTSINTTREYVNTSQQRLRKLVNRLDMPNLVEKVLNRL